MTPKPQLLPQLTDTNEENERAGGGGDWPAQNGTGVQPVPNPVNCATPFDSPISPATQSGQEYLTPITDGETKPEEGTRLGLDGCSIPGEGHTSGLGMAVGAGSSQGGRPLCCWGAGISGPSWETLWAWGKPVPTPGPQHQGLYQEQRLVIDQFGGQEAWAAS